MLALLNRAREQADAAWQAGFVPHSIQTDAERNIALVTLSGDIFIDDVSALFQEIQERFTGQAYSALIDISAADLHGDTATVRKVANFERIFVRLAICAPSPVLYGMARAYEAFSQLYRDRRVAVFRSHSDALRWLMSAAANNKA